jgi:hypothetical protein
MSFNSALTQMPWRLKSISRSRPQLEKIGLGWDEYVVRIYSDNPLKYQQLRIPCCKMSIARRQSYESTGSYRGHVTIYWQTILPLYVDYSTFLNACQLSNCTLHTECIWQAKILILDRSAKARYDFFSLYPICTPTGSWLPSDHGRSYRVSWISSQNNGTFISNTLGALTMDADPARGGRGP